MAVLDIDYICQDCGMRSSDSHMGMLCEDCGGKLKGYGSPGVHGTRDSFGIKNSFKDDQTGIEVDTWKKWEKAGFRNPLETIKDGNVKAGIKRKIDKIKHEKNKGV